MLVVCWSPKGGVGTSVVAAALALRAAADGTDTLLVDLAGDQPAVLGIDVGGREGVADWMAAGEDVPIDALAALEIPVADRLALLPRGGAAVADRLAVLGGVLGAGRRTVVVDAGLARDVGWAPPGHRSVVVLRTCYLAARRAGTLPASSRLVVVDEPGRALRPADMAAAVGVECWVRLPTDPAVARAVDAGLLVARLPRSLRPLVLPT